MLAADWDAIKSSFANPAARSEAVLATAAAAAASAVQAAADTARHVAAGNTAAADASAAAADSAAAAARNNTRVALALAHEVAAASAVGLMAAGPAAGLAGPAVVPAGPAAGPAVVPAGVAVSTISAAEPLAAEPGPAAGAITLRRGGCMLLLVPNTKLWRQLSKPLSALGGSISIRSAAYSRYTIAQLMTPTGLLLQAGQQQRVQVRVAHEFIAGRPRSGYWAKQPCAVDVWPGETLLLWQQPSHRLGRKFGGDAASHAYPALFSTFTDERLAAAIGALELDGAMPQQRAAATAAAAAINALQQRQPAAPVTSAPVLLEPAAVVGPFSAPSSSSSNAPSSTAALDAVSELAMALSDQADAAHAAAVATVVPLLRLAEAAVAAAVKQGLKELYAAARDGAAVPAGVLQAVTSSIRALAGPAVPAACVSPVLTGAAIAPEQQQQQGGGSKRTAHASIAASSSSSSSKKAKAQERPPPVDADNRPGLWLPGNFYVQHGDLYLCKCLVRQLPGTRAVS